MTPLELHNRKFWFINHVGKILYRTLGEGESKDSDLYKIGQHVNDEEHAIFLFELEKDSVEFGDPIKFFASIGERLRYELMHPRDNKKTPDLGNLIKKRREKE